MTADLSTRGRLAPLALCAALALSCHGADHPGACAGAERPQLDCSSEIRYDATDVQGGFAVLGVGDANAKSETVALRQMDAETQRYVAQSRRLCDEYNKCVLDRDSYTAESENLRRRLAKLPDLQRDIRQAKDPDARMNAISAAYQALVPDERRVELTLEFTILAQSTTAPEARTVRSGDALDTGTHVAFALKLSRTAFVYLFQRDPRGGITTLFPDPRIPIANPVSAGEPLKIPAGNGTFVLNDKDIGEEQVYIVASLEPVPSLETAYQQAAAGGPSNGTLQGITSIGSPNPACNRRALELEGASVPCVRSRGLELAQDAQANVSLKTQTEAADSTIVKVFSFRHTN